MDSQYIAAIAERDFQEGYGLREKTWAATKPSLTLAGELIIEALQGGKKILLCGNGGSAADAQHFAGELLGKFYLQRRALPAIALSTNTSVLTAIGNDASFDNVFQRQVEGLGQKGDVLICISTSGNSANVVRAAEQAMAMGIHVVALTGAGGGRLAGYTECLIAVPSDSTPRIQEMHEVIGHSLCHIVEEVLCGECKQSS